MDKIQEHIQQSLALEIANKSIQIAGLQAELEAALEQLDEATAPQTEK